MLTLGLIRELWQSRMLSKRRLATGLSFGAEARSTSIGIKAIFDILIRRSTIYAQSDMTLYWSSYDKRFNLEVTVLTEAW